MRRPWFILTLLLVLCVAAMAQQQRTLPALPDPSQTAINDGLYLASLFQTAQSNLDALDSRTIALQTGTKNLGQDEAQITDYQNFRDQRYPADLKVLQDRVTALETALKALQPQTPPATVPQAVVFDFSQQADGLVSTFQTLTFSPGNWRYIAGYLSPASDGQPTRSITFASPVTVTGVLYMGTSITLIDAVGSNPPASGVVLSADGLLVTGWTKPTTQIRVTGTGSASATSLRIHQIQVLQ